ncbi:MAG: RNA 3'-terminal phosphate cyclase [Phycisphaerales bacterium JB060]
MINLDGSLGEGGGQILRSALALSMVTGQPFRIENIRANRDKPGLMRQHLTAVRAAVEVGRARVEGDAIGSTAITFTPGTARGGDYTFAIGTAGSTTLVLQTVLPALLTAPEPATLEISGGTHNGHAPTVHFLQKAFVPVIERMGAKVEVDLVRHGFYPAGGGKISVRIEPARSLTPIEILERGKTTRRLAIASVAGLSGSIAKRELAVIAKRLTWLEHELRIDQLPEGVGPGNVIGIELESEHTAEVFTGFGERGVSAEKVAEAVAGQVRRYMALDAPVGEHLADQLLLPMALAGGGAFRTGPLSRHCTTNAHVIERFLPVKIHTEGVSQDPVTVRVLG